MKVGLVVNGFPVLSETFIYNQAVGLRAAGIDVSVIAANDHDDAALFAEAGAPRFDGAIKRGVLDRSAPSVASRTIAQLARSSGRAFELWERARQRYGTSRRAVRAWLLASPLADLDIVHFEYSGLAVAWLDALPLLAPAKLVVSCRGTAERITAITNPARAAQLREVFALVDRVHCVSEDMLRGCERLGLPRGRGFVNHPAVDPQRFARGSAYVARSAGPFRLLSTGRLQWAKGLDLGIMGVREAVARGADVRYEIIGAGPDEDRLAFAIHDLGLADRVSLVGRKSPDDVRRALEAADVYVLPSVSEGVSNAALEAMAMEVPVITTDAGGMPEAIRDGIDGVVVPRRDAASLGAAIAALVADPARRQRLSAAGRARVVDAFSIDRQISTFVAEYEAL